MNALRKANQPVEEPDVIELTPEEAMATFDRQARRLAGMSGAEFLQRWDAGEFQPVPDETPEDRRLARLVLSLPLGNSIVR